MTRATAGAIRSSDDPAPVHLALYEGRLSDDGTVEPRRVEYFPIEDN
ncbi:MAG: hypothetical protein GY939_18775 [Actinomycetia bacterium]|nr:hypothetical protein [Actinomycetes bacterium]